MCKMSFHSRATKRDYTKAAFWSYDYRQRFSSQGRRHGRNSRRIPQPNEVRYAFAENGGPNTANPDLAH